VTLGDLLHALRFLLAVAAGLRVLLTGLIAREPGARRFGIVLACVCVMDRDGRQSRADSPERLQELFASVKFAGRVEHPLSMPYQLFDGYVCRKPKFGTLEKGWPYGKRWG